MAALYWVGMWASTAARIQYRFNDKISRAIWPEVDSDASTPYSSSWDTVRGCGMALSKAAAASVGVISVFLLASRILQGASCPQVTAWMGSIVVIHTPFRT
jgi:hypothetical protein